RPLNSASCLLQLFPASRQQLPPFKLEKERTASGAEFGRQGTGDRSGGEGEGVAGVQELQNGDFFSSGLLNSASCLLQLFSRHQAGNWGSSNSKSREQQAGAEFLRQETGDR